jgi:uncharacterized protein (TIGR02246 family)
VPTLLNLKIRNRAADAARRRNARWAIAILLAGGLSWPGAAGGADETGARDEQAIRAAAKQYVEALAQGDAKTLSALWVPDGDIVDEFGRSTPAREVIDREAKAREAPAESPKGGPEVNLGGSTIRFLTSDVAVEDGRVDVTAKDQPPRLGRFTAIWVRGDGRWRLATLREARISTSTADDLAALDAMVGQWTGQAGTAQLDASARWNDKHTFLEREITVTHDGRVIMDGRQRIGIDPIDGKIKSWMHDSDGGHGEGVWTRHGDAWIVQATGVSPDGKRTASTNVYTFDGPESLTWKSDGGYSGGEKVAGFEIKLKRVVGVE